MTDAILHGFLSALVGWVWAGVLPNNPTPLAPWHDLLMRLEVNHPMIAKPLGACAYCFSGQLSLWTAVYQYGWPCTAHSFAFLAVTTATSVTVAYFLSKWQ